MSNIIEALTLQPDAGIFTTQYWPDRHVAFHGNVERFLSTSLRAVPTDVNALFAIYRGRVFFSKGTRKPYSFSQDGINPKALYDMGLSLWLPDVETYVAGAAECLRELEASLRLPVGAARMTAWISPAGEKVNTHYDAEEIFSIQLSGKKLFHVSKAKAVAYPTDGMYVPGSIPSEEVFAQFSNGFPDPEQVAYDEITMMPGSTLFIPRGSWHGTVSPEDSYSLSIGLRTPSGVDVVLQALRKQLLQDPAWRRPFYDVEEDLTPRIAGLSTIVSNLKKQDLFPCAGRPTGDMESDFGFHQYQKIPHSKLSLKLESSIVELDVDNRDLFDATLPMLSAKIDARFYKFLQWIQNMETSFSLSDAAKLFSNITNNEFKEICGFLGDAGYIKGLKFGKIYKAYEI